LFQFLFFFLDFILFFNYFLEGEKLFLFIMGSYHSKKKKVLKKEEPTTTTETATTVQQKNKEEESNKKENENDKQKDMSESIDPAEKIKLILEQEQLKARSDFLRSANHLSLADMGVEPESKENGKEDEPVKVGSEEISDNSYDESGEDLDEDPKDFM
jgi:hypothetical protein